jgi:hypothetical protein
MSKDVSKPKVRQAIILVTVHEDGPSQTSVTRPAYNAKQGYLGLYMVDVFPSDIHEDKLVDIAAHEFGHVLATLFGTPGALGDPRRGATPQMRHALATDTAPLEVIQRSVDAEAEAWDFAQKMWPDLDPATREANLNTYKEGLKVWRQSGHGVDAQEAALSRLQQLIAQISR